MATSELLDNLIHRINVGDSLTRTAYRYPDALAIIDREVHLSYQEFNAWVNRMANALLARGYRGGDVLALAAANSVEFLVTYYACAKAGTVCVPINLGWRPDEVAYALGHSNARGIVIETQLIEAIAPAIMQSPGIRDVIVAKGANSVHGGPIAGLATVDFEVFSANATATEPEEVIGDRDALTYLYTSGTTSFPKGVIGNHAAIYLESMTMALEGRFAPDDRFVAMMPMFHTAQLNCHCTPAVMVGATIFVERRFSAPRLLELIESEHITQIFGLPMMYRELLECADIAARDLSSLRRALYAMAPMPEAQLKKCIEVFDCDFYLLFGQTEMSPTTTIFRPEHQLTHNGAVGTPVVNVQVGIMDEAGSLLPQGSQGEIVYRGPHTMTGYLRNPEATEAAFANGWFHSGDVGVFDSDGILWFADRNKDVIKTGGENVASIEVEKAIFAADPNVAEAVVVGLPHPRWSEAVTAVAVPRVGSTIDEATLLAKVRTIIDPYKVPKAVIVVESLSKTSTGKIQKNLIREQFSQYYEEPQMNQGGLAP
jgi:acyl-CoA synthetase (AMP-forming)/AMP-acid ligase II